VASGPLAGLLKYSTDPIVSRDIIGDSASCVFDAPLTQESGTLAKVFGWYDNQWGYTCRWPTWPCWSAPAGSAGQPGPTHLGAGSPGFVISFTSRHPERSGGTVTLGPVLGHPVARA
jgi:hypothetical protein